MKFPFLSPAADVRLKQHLLYLTSRTDREFVAAHQNQKQKIIIGLACDYANLGDAAITIAQEQYLQKLFPEAEILIVPVGETYTKMKSLKQIVKPGDLITLVGGGNSGELYETIEAQRQFFIKQFREYPIISFPQTVVYSKTVFGQKKLQQAQRRYRVHSQLQLCAREQYSQHFYAENFSNQVHLVPDIVLAMNQTLAETKRQGFLLCLRQDKERRLVFPKELEEKLINERQAVFIDTQLTADHLTRKEQKKALQHLFERFQGAELVVTDRLHGMIFCALTGTPCIALDNCNRKVSGVYEQWLAHTKNICLLKNHFTEADFFTAVRKVTTAKPELLDFAAAFQPLSDLLAAFQKGDE